MFAARADGGWVVAVADGLGGHPRGAEAAQAAIEAVAGAAFDLGGDGMRRMFADADARVAALRPGPMKIGDLGSVPMSTLAVAASLPGSAHAAIVAWAGDTLVFRIAAEGDSLVAAPVGSGHNDQFGFGTIIRCLGNARSDPEVAEVAWGGPGTGTAVLSDGMWAKLLDHLPRSDGREGFEVPLVCDWGAGEVAELLAGWAEGFGLSDNASAAVACAGGPPGG